MEDALGLVPTERLLCDLAALLKKTQHDQISAFLSEFDFLLTDDVAEQEREANLNHRNHASGNDSARSKSKLLPPPPPPPPQQQKQYMFFPLNLMEPLLISIQTKQQQQQQQQQDCGVSDLLQSYLMSPENCNSPVDARLRKLFGEAFFTPLQIVYRAAMPSTTADARRQHHNKHRAARANQERQAYNRMMRGANSAAGAGGGTFFSLPPSSSSLYPGGVDPSTMRLDPNRGGVGFISKDNFSSSSQAEIEEGVAAAAEPPPGNLVQRLSRDVGIGLDVPLMAAAGAVVGYYACMLRGMSDSECAVGAAVCATVFFLVDAGLVLMKLARQDLTASSEKRRAAEAILSASAAAASSSSSKPKNVVAAAKVLKRENLNDWKR